MQQAYGGSSGKVVIPCQLDGSQTLLLQHGADVHVTPQDGADSWRLQRNPISLSSFRRGNINYPTPSSQHEDLGLTLTGEESMRPYLARMETGLYSGNKERVLRSPSYHKRNLLQLKASEDSPQSR